MIKTQAYGATSAADKTIKPLTITRNPPTKTELLIEVLYCGICHSDKHILDNAWGFTLYPLIPGHEAVGRVLQAGPDATKFKIDDIVGVGCMMDSCMACEACREGWENHCEAATGPTMTYGGYLNADGSGFNTFGAWSDRLVVREEFVVRIPEGMDLARAAPLMCPGVATYGPLKRFDIKKGDKVAIVGIGGPGHLAIQFAKALGATVTAITSHPSKLDPALSLGADGAILSTDGPSMRKHANHFHHILSTIPNAFDPTPYLNLLRRRGTMTVMGLLGPYEKVVNNITLAARGLSLTGSMIGSVAETHEVLEFCAEKGIMPVVEVVKVGEINEAVERLSKADVRFRFVIDLKA